eukprot:m.124074 g.124074  ORF g.124074 m.124074 type:complete len:684 (-) comp9663_c0_seq3:28-2079(-)
MNSQEFTIAGLNEHIAEVAHPNVDWQAKCADKRLKWCQHCRKIYLKAHKRCREAPIPTDAPSHPPQQWHGEEMMRAISGYAMRKITQEVVTKPIHRIDEHIEAAFSVMLANCQSQWRKATTSTPVDQSLKRGAEYLFLLLPALVFGRSPRGFPSQSKIKSRLQKLMSPEWKIRVDELVGAQETGHKPPTPEGNARRAAGLADVGEFSRAYRALGDAALRPPVDIGDEQIERHFPRQVEDAAELQPPLPANVEAFEALVNSLEEKDLAAVLNKSSKKTKSGVTAWSGDLLRLLQAQCGGHVLFFIKQFLLGKCEPQLAKWLYGGGMFMIPKSNGGERPIVPQSGLARLMERLLFPAHQTIRAQFAPFQHGVAVKDGANIVVIAVQSLLSVSKPADGTDPDGTTSSVAAMIDLTNAFGSCNRRAVQDALRESEYAYLETIFYRFYGVNPCIAYRDGRGALKHAVLRKGLTQGACLSPIYFSTLLQSALVAAKDDDPTVEVLAYLDDVTIVGPLDKVLAAVERFIQAIEPLGLKVNGTKTKIFAPHFREQQQVQVNNVDVMTTKNSVVLLGVPLGPTNAAWSRQPSPAVQKIMDEVSAAMTRLRLMNDPQNEMHLLRYCVQTKPMFLYGALPPQETRPLATFFKKMITKEVARICNAQEGQVEQRQIFTRLAQGGDGFLGVCVLKA